MKVSTDYTGYIPAEVVMRDGGTTPDLSSDVVQMAFPAEKVKPVGGDWKTASWEVDATTTPRRYLARCLVGPTGSFTLAAGVYDVWVKVTHSPEVPVLKARGQLEVF